MNYPPAPTPERYLFHTFALDSAARTLLREGTEISLTPKAFETLVVLVRNAGKIVRKQALMDEVWSDTNVEESVLTQNIYTLRRALGDSGPSHRFITTVPRIGFRFVASVKAVHGRDPDAAPSLASLAVLPFESLTRGEDETMLSLGMTDALITRLSGIRSLSVRPTSSVLAAQSRLGDKGMHLMGIALGVDAVVEGRIQLAGGRVRATVQLVEVSSQTPLWGEQFDTDERDLFAVQDSISKQIAGKLRLELSSQERDRLSQGTQNDNAYRAYLRGRYFWNRREAHSLRQAVDYFERAIAADPNWALPQAGLADSYVLMPLFGDQPAKDCFTRARRAAVRALEIEPDLAEAHTSLAYARLIHDWDVAGAEHSWRQALRLQPRYPTARHWLGFALAGMGRFEEAVIQGSRAVELAPLSLVINADLGWIHYFARQYREAAEQFQRSLELDPQFSYGELGYALVLLQLGRAEEAAQIVREVTERNPEQSFATAIASFVLGRSGHANEAQKLLDALLEMSESHYLPASRLALAHLGCGDVEQSITSLQTAADERSRFAVFLGVWPAFDRLRERSDFRQLVDRIGMQAF